MYGIGISSDRKLKKSMYCELIWIQNCRFIFIKLRAILTLNNL